ncbi:hypothetical protein ACS5PN_13170 [Roseateles sp. NT4]|uniref:hypothetical protein n=1 Tax=Roseateles sp. NT4 TaxID=3453715 RepID=UPI003EEB5693
MKLLLPLLLTPLAALQRARLVAAEPSLVGQDPVPSDWSHAYQRLRDQTLGEARPSVGGEAEPVAVDAAPPGPVSPSLQGTRRMVEESPATAEALPIPQESGAWGWRNAGSGLRNESETAAIEPTPPATVGLLPTPGMPEPALTHIAPLSPTALRVIEAVQQVAEPAPASTPLARVWQVELPSTGPAWQLRVEQAQPQAPLQLELRVPPVVQAQARQQLTDLDKRLRDAGHEVLRLRLKQASRSGKSRGPLDEVTS